MGRRNNKDISEYKKEFYEHYNTKISPLLDVFEQDRKKRLWKLLREEILWLAIIGIFIWACLKLDSTVNMDTYLNSFWIFQAVSLIGGLVILFMFGKILAVPYYAYKEFSKKLKTECIPKVMEVFTNLKWYSEKDVIMNGSEKFLIRDKTLRDSQLFSSYNTRSADDAFEGTYKGVKFKISETSMMHISGSGKTKNVVDVFHGVIVNFKINKMVWNTTIVATKNDTRIKNRAAFGILGMLYIMQLIFVFFDYDLTNPWPWGITIVVWIIVIAAIVKLNKSANEEELHELKLEDIEFEKRYKAYSSDDVEGRYMLTTAFMERFKNLHTAFGSNRAKCSFYGDHKLMFAISTRKNLFEIGNLFQKLNNPKRMDNFFNELASVMEMIDYFKLDENTGL